MTKIKYNYVFDGVPYPVTKKNEQALKRFFWSSCPEGDRPLMLVDRKSGKVYEQDNLNVIFNKPEK